MLDGEPGQEVLGMWLLQDTAESFPSITLFLAQSSIGQAFLAFLLLPNIRV